MFQKMLSTLKVIDHDFGSGGEGKFVLFVAKDAAKKISLTAKIYADEEGENRSAVQYSCDFTHLPGDLQLGIVCVEDLDHKAWPTSYIISPTENSTWAEMVMRITVDLINLDQDASRDKALVDGAQALSNAARALECLSRNCLTHACRLPNGTKKNGKRGTKGSLCAYLSGKGGLQLKEAVKVSFFQSINDSHLLKHSNYILLDCG